MWIKTQDGDFVNADNINYIKLGPMGGIHAIFDDDRILLGSYGVKERAEKVVEDMFFTQQLCGFDFTMPKDKRRNKRK